MTLLKKTWLGKQMLVLCYNLLAFIFLWMYEGDVLRLFAPKLSLQHIAIKEGETKPSINYYLHLAIPKLLGSTQANRRNDKFLNHLDYVVSPVLFPRVSVLNSGQEH